MNNTWQAFSDGVNSLGIFITIGALLYAAGLKRVAVIWIGVLVLGVAVPLAMGIMAAAQTAGGLGQ